MYRKSSWAALVCLLCTMAVVSPMVYAATQNAMVYGTVYDSAGNPLPGATVYLDNAAIGFARTAATGSDGSYNFAEVPPAENYRLSATLGGNKIDTRAGITVNVGDERVILPPLKQQPALAAPVAEVVRKTEQAVRNETVSTTISGVITGEQLRSLPETLNRNFLSLGALTPNTHDPEQGSPLAGASFSVSGNRVATNNFLLDGSDNVASSSNQAVPFQVNDAIQEFRVLSSTANAEYGRNLGGTVNVVTKRGGNAFHGNLFGYFNNDVLNANSPISTYRGTTFDKAAAYAGSPTSTYTSFSPLTYNDYVSSAASVGFCTDSISVAPGPGLSPCAATGGFGKNTVFDPAAVLAGNDSRKVPFDSKQFGANMGGAVVKDKVFVFGSYEGTKINNPNPIFERVPTAFDRTYNPYGDFGYFAANNPNYVLDQNILGLFPKSNVVGVPGVLEFFRGTAPNNTDVHNGLFRTDYVQSKNTSYTARFVIQDLNQLHDDTLPTQSNYAGNGAFRDALNQNLSLTATHSFSQAWITEARVGYNRFAVDEKPQDQNLNVGALGLPGFQMPTIMLNGLNTQYSGSGPGREGAYTGWSDQFHGSPAMFATLDYQFPFARLGAPLGAPVRRRDTTLFFDDNTSWSHGKHGVKFGFDVRRLDNRLSDGSFSRGFMYSSDIGQFTSDSVTCNVACLGAINAFTNPGFDFYQQEASPYASRLHSYGAAGFIQDTWRVLPRVTVNAGLRYEYFSVPTSRDQSLLNFDPVANGLVREGASAVTDPYGNPCPVVSPYPSIPGGASTGFTAGNWNCSATSTSGFSQILKSQQHDFAPRLGVAWDLRGNGKTVLRAAGGIFYDQLPNNFVSQLMYNRINTVPNALFGTVRDTAGLNFCPAGNFTVCSTGSTILFPSVQAATSADGVNPNSFYAQAVMPPAIYARDTAHSATPYSEQVSATIQQEINGNLTLETGYVGNWGMRLPTVYNANFNNEFNLLNTTAGNNEFLPIFTMTNRARSTYHSLMVRVRSAGWHGLRMNATYNWSKSLDDASNGIFANLPVSYPNLAIGYQVFGSDNPNADCIFFGLFCTLGTGEKLPLTTPTINFSPGAVTTTGAGQVLTSRYVIPQDPNNFLKNEKGLSDFNTAHRVVLDYTWDVPTRKTANYWSKFTSNWQLSGVVTAQSGQPFTIFAGPIGGEVNQRVNALGPIHVSDNPNGAITTGNLQLASDGAGCQNQTVTANFVGNFLEPNPSVACTGNTGRNSFTGPIFVNTNFAVQKGFPVFGEGRMLTFRAEVYNLFDRANYFNPISAFSNDGVTLNPDFGKIKSAHEARQIQLAARFAW